MQSETIREQQQHFVQTKTNNKKKRTTCLTARCMLPLHDQHLAWIATFVTCFLLRLLVQQLHEGEEAQPPLPLLLHRHQDQAGNAAFKRLAPQTSRRRTRARINHNKKSRRRGNSSKSKSCHLSCLKLQAVAAHHHHLRLHAVATFTSSPRAYLSSTRSERCLTSCSSSLPAQDSLDSFRLQQVCRNREDPDSCGSPLRSATRRVSKRNCRNSR